MRDSAASADIFLNVVWAYRSPNCTMKRACVCVCEWVSERVSASSCPFVVFCLLVPPLLLLRPRSLCLFSLLSPCFLSASFVLLLCPSPLAPCQSFFVSVDPCFIPLPLLRSFLFCCRSPWLSLPRAFSFCSFLLAPLVTRALLAVFWSLLLTPCVNPSIAFFVVLPTPPPPFIRSSALPLWLRLLALRPNVP